MRRSLNHTFEVTLPEPIDSRLVKDTISDRDSMANAYEGLIVYVKETDLHYIAKATVGNTLEWVVFKPSVKEINITEIDDNGHLIISFSDNTTQDCGKVVGKDGNNAPFAICLSKVGANGATYPRTFSWSYDIVFKEVRLMTNCTSLTAKIGTTTYDANSLINLTLIAGTEISFVDIGIAAGKDSADAIIVIGGNSSVSYSDLAYDLKGKDAISNGNIDFSVKSIYTFTLTANTTLSFSNPQVNKVITLIASGAFTLTFPSSCNKLYGTYNGAVLNYIQIHCTNDSPESYWYTINQAIT
jgi:hypothetical protein